MTDVLLKSKQIIEVAISTYKPNAIVMMMSGGDDSMTAYYVAKELDVPIDLVIHGNTRTGIPDTTQFVINEMSKQKEKLVIADAGSSYEDYVLRKGFFGSGVQAHSFAYHILKYNHFSHAVSKYLRKRQRNFKILFLNGARWQESENRKRLKDEPYKLDPSQHNNIWVNIINDWSKHQCTDYLEGNGHNRNPVSVNLCRSGECMCGTMQSEGDRAEAAFFYPDWGKWIDDLEKNVLKKFPWKWGEQINKRHHMEMKGQLNAFQPMCTGCKINYEKLNK